MRAAANHVQLVQQRLLLAFWQQRQLLLASSEQRRLRRRCRRRCRRCRRRLYRRLQLQQGLVAGGRHRHALSCVFWRLWLLLQASLRFPFESVRSAGHAFHLQVRQQPSQRGAPLHAWHQQARMPRDQE